MQDLTPWRVELDTTAADRSQSRSVWQGFGNSLEMTVGYELRQARQQAGLSREEISESTKIQLAKLEALEQNAFERLPEGVYLDGIVRAYAQTVGLDGDLMVQRTRAALAIRERDAVHLIPAPAPHAAAHEVVYTSAGPVDADLELFPAESDVAYDHGALQAHESRPPEFDADPDPTLLRPAGRRSGALFALIVVVLLSAAGLGGFLYESSRRAANAQDNPGAQGASGASGAPGATSAPDATPVAPNPRRSPEPTPSPATSAAAAATADARQTRRAPEEPTAPGATRDVPAVTREPVTPAAPAPALPAGPASPDLSAAAALSGPWTLDTRIESSSYRDYQGLQLGYQLDLRQDGSRVSGKGVKTTENGRRLGSTAQTPIEFEGTLDGQRLTLTFIERGLVRPSTGKMILELHHDGVLRGRFSSTAAQSVGLVEARRPGG